MHKTFQKNCEDQLDNIGIPKSKNGLLLDEVFGKDGLVESEDKKDLKMKMEVAYSVLDPYEKAITGSENAKFSTYLREREKTVLRKLIRDSRRKALKTDAKNPPRLYTNQPESFSQRKRVPLVIVRKTMYGCHVLYKVFGKVLLTTNRWR